MATRAKSSKEARQRRHMRLRRRLSGTAERPRMSVCTSGKNIYVQFIDDIRGHTLAAVSTLETGLREQNVKANLQGAESVGKVAAERAQALGIKQVVFDRGGFKYHGRIKTLAEAARQGGLEF